MLTARGWASLGTAAALLLLWAGLGDRELLALGVFLGLAVGIGLLVVRRSRIAATIVRRVAPIQLYEGDRAVVEIELDALSAIRGATLEDEVVGLGTARFPTGRLDRGASVVARYEILCRPRGIYQVGPAHLVTTDPLGLAETRTETGLLHRLVVYPAVEDLEGYPLLRGHNPAVQSSQPTFTPHGGEDFFTLREYRLGDDLRRVHWPSSAKRDELMIRQLEIPWQSRALVLLDTRALTFLNRDSFETALRGTASIIRHFHIGGYAPELWLGDAGPPPTGNRYLSAMERLAAVETSKTLDIRAAVARLRRKGLAGGALVMVIGFPDDNHLAAFQALGRDYARTVLFVVSDYESERLVYFRRGGASVAEVGTDGSWARSWSEAMRATWPTVSAG